MQQRKSLRLFRRWLVVIGILLGFFVGATAKVWTPEEVPVPRYHDRTQYVSNPEDILSQTTVDSLNPSEFGGNERSANSGCSTR